MKNRATFLSGQIKIDMERDRSVPGKKMIICFHVFPLLNHKSSAHVNFGDL